MRTLWTLGLAAVVAIAVFAAAPAEPASATYGTGARVHCVKYGETLYRIAHHYGVSAHQIAYHNGLYNPNHIKAGQCLKIPYGGSYGTGYHQPAKKAPHYGSGYGTGYKAPSHSYDYSYSHKKKSPYGYGSGYAAPSHSYGKKTGNRYCVRYGDTLGKIAYRYGTSAYAIAHANGIYNKNYIRAGQCLTIPGHAY